MSLSQQTAVCVSGGTDIKLLLSLVKRIKMHLNNKLTNKKCDETVCIFKYYVYFKTCS